MLTKKEVKTSFAMVGVNGATAHITDVDGEIVFSVGFLPGVHPLSSLARFMYGDTFLSLDDGADVVDMAGQRVGIHRHPQRRDSGANPSFQPARMTDAEVRMRRLMDQHTERVARMLENKKKNAQPKETADDEVLQVQQETEAEAPQENAEASAEVEGVDGKKA